MNKIEKLAMKAIPVILTVIGMIMIDGCAKEISLGLIGKCNVEYIDEDGDGLYDVADVTLVISLTENSTDNYTKTTVLWDDNVVLTSGGLPVEYTQTVDLAEDAAHKFSFRCERSENGSTKISEGMIPVLVEDGVVSADYEVHIGGGISIK